MTLIELTESDKQDYNHFVASQRSGSFLQSWEWGDWQVSLGRVVYRFILQGKVGEKIGSIQLIQTSLFGGKYYLYAPYGPVINDEFHLSDDRLNFKFLAEELLKRFGDAMFIRLEPQQNTNGITTLGKKSTNIQPGVTISVDIHKPNEALLAAMHPKTRYNIKVAERHGVEIQSELAVTPIHGLYVQQAVDLIVQTQIRQKYRGHNALYYHKLIDYFALHNRNSDLKIHIYKALFEKELIASGIMVDFGKIRMYLYGGSSENHKNVMAPYLLHWKAMQDARELGIDHYDLGGSEVASGGERGFTKFKRGFGGTVIEYAGAYDIVFNRLWYTIYASGRVINRVVKKLK